ncbi:MAG: mechanosensitive ion channel domain-containing protein [Leptolyngbyaceae bacterium]|nr:mechanosensitive ion channel domain-containing protein [Leptolyngbyaceae bacterium]
MEHRKTPVLGRLRFHPSRSSRFMLLWAIALLMVLWIGGGRGLPTYGLSPLETNPEIADVVLDGQSLFEVTPYGNTTARDRADLISSKLADAIDNSISVSRNSTSIVLLDATGETVENGRLLTVSKSDVQYYNQTYSTDLTAAQLAAEWESEIQDALDRARNQRTPDVFRQSLLFSAAALILAAIAHWWLRRVQRRVLEHPLQALRRLLQQSESDTIQIRSTLIKCTLSISLFLLRIVFWAIAIGYVINSFPQTRVSGYRALRTVQDSLFSPVFPLGDNSYSVIDLLVLLGAFFGIFLAATLITNVLRSRILNIAGLSAGSREAIAALTRYTLIALGALVILQVWGLDLSSLTLLASALGVGIGFGFQNIARDFGSGLILLFERPVQVGDFVEVGDYKGTVDRIGARSTSVKTLDRISVIVPNSYFLENQVINWSHENPLSRISIPVGVSYSSDPEQVRTLLLKAADKHSSVVNHPKPQVFFDGFGDSALNFRLLVWIVNPDRQLIIKSDLYFQVFAVFKENNITIPFPQRDLHVRSGHLPISLDASTQSNESHLLNDLGAENGGS